MSFAAGIEGYKEKDKRITGDTLWKGISFLIDSQEMISYGFCGFSVKDCNRI